MSVKITPQNPRITISASSESVHPGVSVIKEYLPVYSGATIVIPTTEAQTLETAGKKLTDNITVRAVTEATWRGGSALDIDPAISVDANGLITASFDSTIPVTPISGSGWADKTRTYPVRAHGSKTQQLSALPATNYEPGASQIIIPRGKFLTGDQTIQAVAPPYYNMGGDMAWLGKGAELVDGNLYSATFKLSDTEWSSWTPGTTAGVMVTSVTQSAKFTASDMANNEYAIIWECGFDPVWDGTETLKALPLLSRAYLVQQLFRRPNSWAMIQAANANANTCASAFTGTFMRYYGTTTGTATYTYSASYGFYFSLVASTFSSSTSDNPTVTLKTPSMSARCNTTYFSTGNAAKIDTVKSTGYIRGKLYRIKRDGFLRGIYNNVVRLINEE
ncbi:MAG: hypothetical protein ACSW8H_06530 [bacterium]